MTQTLEINTAQQAKTLLSVNQLRTHFFSEHGEVQAVRDVSFELKEGEILGIVGESGSGKSITCMSILRLLKSTGKILNGEVNWLGTDLLALDEEAIRKMRGEQIGVIFQDPMSSLNPLITVGEQVIETLLCHKNMTRSEAKARAIELFELVKIPSASSRLNAYPHEFSGGMRQRIMIAIALACDPKLLIADEPTTALDVTIQRQILQLLKELQQKLGMSIILITHDLGVIAEMADRMLVMYSGMIMESGSVETIFNSPTHPYTQGLLNSTPQKALSQKQRLKSIPGTPPDMRSPPTGCGFAPRCEYAMQQCLEACPPFFTPQSTQEYDKQISRCWLHHPNAPRIDGINV